MYYHLKSLGCQHPLVVVAGACATCLLCAVSVSARQNILIGDMTVRYDHQDRTYRDSDAVVPLPGGDGTVVAAGDETAPEGIPVIVLDDRQGDRKQYQLSPRLTWSSTGINDSMVVTYAPILNYDHLDETTNFDQSFGLQLDRDLSRTWSLSVGNTFFLGDDPLLQEEQSAAIVSSDTQREQAVEPVTGSPGEVSNDSLTERYGRRRYWTNDFNLSTEYGYGLDQSVHAGYTFSVLRNEDSDNVGGYTDYDRHTGVLGVDHRFDSRWSGQSEFRYTRGLFDQPDIYLVTLDAEEDPDVAQVAGNGSDDLSEYDFRLRGGYDANAHLHWFAEYDYQMTDYDAVIREDYHVNNFALGVDYDISPHLHLTLSGGPSWGAFDNSPTETDYNAYGGISWDYLHGGLTLSVEKGYDQSNFDGRRSGLTDYWQTGISLDYQFTPNLSGTLSTSYRDNRRLQFPTPQTIIIVDDETELPPEEDFERIEYTEKNYDLGFSLAYTFLRWYTVSGGYRYYHFDTDQMAGGAGTYYEHRAFITLGVSYELLRW